MKTADTNPSEVDVLRRGEEKAESLRRVLGQVDETTTLSMWIRGCRMSKGLEASCEDASESAALS